MTGRGGKTADIPLLAVVARIALEVAQREVRSEQSQQPVAGIDRPAQARQRKATSGGRS